MELKETYTWQMMKALIDCHKREGGDKDSLIAMLLRAAAESATKYGLHDKITELANLTSSDDIADKAQFLLGMVKIVSIDTYKDLTEAQKSEWDSMMRKAEIEVAMLRNK